MNARARLNRGTMWGLLGLLAVGLFLPLASAAPVPASWQNPNPNAPPQTWAWGAVFAKTDSGSLSGITSNGTAYSLTYSIHAFLGWNTVLTQTNTSTTSFTLAEQRVVVASYYLSAQGSYGNLNGNLNVTAQGWENASGSADFVTNGTVLLNGTTSVPALAIVDAQGQTAGNFTATSSASLSGSQTATWNGYASAEAHAQASVGFQPPLGLLPLNVTAGSTWTSTSAYSAQGNYTVGCHYGFYGSSALGTASGGGNCGASGSASGTGTVTLVGSDLGIDDGVGHGDRAISVGLEGTFGFHLRDGLILVPDHADLFAGAAASSASGAPAAGTQLGTAHVDLDTHASHLGLVASNVQFAPQVGLTLSGGNPGAVGGPSAAAAGVAPAAASGLSSYTVQGQPESASQAQQSNACLLSGACSAPAKGGLLGPVLLLVIVVAVIAVIVGAVLLERGRRPKAPVGGYSSRPPSAFLLHNAPGVAPSPARGTVPPPQTPRYSPGRPPA